MSKVDKFIVSNKNGAMALPHVLRKKRSLINTYSICPQEGRITFTLGYDEKPDSDWGKYLGPVIRVIVTDLQYMDVVESQIRFALGWDA